MPSIHQEEISAATQEYMARMGKLIAREDPLEQAIFCFSILTGALRGALSREEIQACLERSMAEAEASLAGDGRPVEKFDAVVASRMNPS